MKPRARPRGKHRLIPDPCVTLDQATDELDTPIAGLYLGKPHRETRGCWHPDIEPRAWERKRLEKEQRRKSG